MNNSFLWLLLLLLAAAIPWVIALLFRAGDARSASSRAGQRVKRRHVAGGTPPPEPASPPQLRRRRRWIAVALLAVLYGWLLFKHDLWFLWHGEPAEGTVVAEGKYGRKYQFRDAAGNLYTGPESLRSDRFPLGESVHVRYLADDPEQNCLIESWGQRDAMSLFLFPVIAFAWYGWVYIFWIKGSGAWRAFAEQYPDIGAGTGWQPWWFQGAQFDLVGASSPMRISNLLSVSAGANGLRFAGQVPFRYLLMPWHPAFVIPWSDLRAEPTDGQWVKLTAARVPGAGITIPGQLANALAANAGDAWPATVLEAPSAISPAPTSPSAERLFGEPAGGNDVDAFMASLQAPPRPPPCEASVSAEPDQPDVQPGSPPSNPHELRLSERDRVLPEVQFIAESLAFQLIGLCVLIGLCFLLGAGTRRQGWIAPSFLVGLGLVITLSLPAGFYRFLVGLAARRFNERFPEGDADRSAALDVLRGNKSLLRASQTIWNALTRSSPGSEANYEAAPRAALPEPPPARPAHARAQSIILEKPRGTCVVEPTSLSPGKSTVLFQRSPDCLEFVPGRVGWLIGVAAVGFCALFVVGVFLTLATEPGASWVSALGLMVPIGFAIWGLWTATSRARVDRLSGEVWLASFFRERLACRIGDIIAVQAVAVTTYGRHGASTVYQVNLVRSDPKQARINLASYGVLSRRDRKDVLCHGRRLAAFLGVPLVDQIETMAVLFPPQSIGEVSSHPAVHSYSREKPLQASEKPVDDQVPALAESIQEARMVPGPQTSEGIRELTVRAKDFPTLMVETRGRTCRVEPTTLRNVGISDREGYKAVLRQFPLLPHRLDFKSSPESFAALFLMVVTCFAIVWALYSWVFPAVAIMVGLLLIISLLRFFPPC
jgi:hypothetical protein